jgi:hypothetical protein
MANADGITRGVYLLSIGDAAIDTSPFKRV